MSESQPPAQAGVGREVRPYLGGAIGGALPAVRTSGAWGAVGPHVALRGGLSFERNGLQGSVFQVQLDIGLTGLFGKNTELPSGLVESTVSAAALIPIGPRAWWILRVGGGGAISGGGWAMGFGEIRGDVTGVVIRTSEHIQVEFTAPSFRYYVGGARPVGNRTSNVPGLLSWVTSVAVDYVF